MLKSSILWPLENNIIRKKSVNNTFGMVRNGGERAHQGWDLFANPGTPIFAIAEGSIVVPAKHKDYGLVIVHKFHHDGQDYFAAYCHLDRILVRSGQSVSAGDVIGYSGNSGNAESMKGEDQHLHFEIRSIQYPGKGLGGRIDPKSIYGMVPLTESVWDQRLTLKPLISAAQESLRVLSMVSLVPVLVQPGMLPGISLKRW